MVTTRSRSRQVDQVDDPADHLTVETNGDLLNYTRKEVKKIAKDSRDALYRLAAPTPESPRDKRSELRLVVPEALRPDILHHAHEDFQSGHQGITRTYERLRSELFWTGMFQDVEMFVKECTDCASAKGRPPNPGPSPGNIGPTGPFEVVSMNFVTHLPKSERGNTFLLLFQYMFTGYVMCKPMSSTTAQDCAEAYEEVVFRNYGASSEIRHDRDSRFMSRVFRCFSEMMGIQQKATLAYRPQANGQQERSGLTIMHSIRAPDQTNWDDHAEKIMHAINTSFNVTRLDTPFYLLHGFDCRSTIAAMLGPKPTDVAERTAYEWRRLLQRDYSYAHGCAEELQRRANRPRSAVQTQKWEALSDHLKSGFEVGDSVWLYIPKVLPGLSRKLAHLIERVRDDFKVKLKVQGTGYRVEPWVHICRLKPRALFPKRPSARINVPEDDGFDAARCRRIAGNQIQYTRMEEIVDLRWAKRTRNAKRIRKYLIKWRG
ncbi:LOW QUALITY PROTEIN: reverse transcriptase [Phytophthora megakarya]|uniref:Reverse transcriptase n=1 Tax=Phytophthora megakarya TaxID=4795 RepID=A0A225V9G2_9STRA|nr:LOW QUALITY PROTEIN: reverse transcriptase [Phytophthora megakarya]